MGEDEVLAAGLAHDAGIVAVGGDILADLLPDALEDFGGASEVEAGQFPAGEDVLGHIGTVAGHEVDDARRKSAVHEQLHVVIVRKHRRAGGLPERHITHDGRSCGQIPADGGEVEGRDGADEPVQGPIVLPIPDAGDGGGLILEYLLGGPDAEAEEVRQLRDVDLRLEDGLGLAQHGGGVQHLAVEPRDHVGCLEEDSGPMLPGHVLPGLLGGQGGVHGHGQFLLAGHGALCDHVAVIVGHGDLDGLLREDLLSADDQRDLHHLGRLTEELFFQLRPLFRAGQIAAESVIVGTGDCEISVWHNSSFDRLAHQPADTSLRILPQGLPQ